MDQKGESTSVAHPAHCCQIDHPRRGQMSPTAPERGPNVPHPTAGCTPSPGPSSSPPASSRHPRAPLSPDASGAANAQGVAGPSRRPRWSQAISANQDSRLAASLEKNSGRSDPSSILAPLENSRGHTARVPFRCFRFHRPRSVARLGSVGLHFGCEVGLGAVRGRRARAGLRTETVRYYPHGPPDSDLLVARRAKARSTLPFIASLSPKKIEATSSKPN